MSTRHNASRSRGTIDRPCAQTVKLTDGENVRLHAAIARESKPSVQAALLEATMRWIEESERRQIAREEQQEREQANRKKWRVKTPDSSLGLGIKPAAEPDPEIRQAWTVPVPEMPQPASPAPRPAVPPVAPVPAAAAETPEQVIARERIEKLAQHVVSGHGESRVVRRIQVEDMVRAAFMGDPGGAIDFLDAIDARVQQLEDLEPRGLFDFIQLGDQNDR